MKKSSAIFSLILILVFSFTAVPWVAGLQSSPTAQPQTSPSGASPAPAQSPTVSPEASPQPSATPEHKLTPAEEKDLLASVDEILHFAGTDTLLPVKHNVKRAIVSREHVARYLDEKMESDVDRIRFERSELVLKKFGLLPRTFDLHSFLLKLLTEQVAGYYDEKTKTMNLLDWNEAEMQKPVMAHELTHALQDQSYNLEKMSKHEEEIEKHGLEDLDALLRNDEASSARSAVLEGQAMIVMLDYVLAPMGHSVQERPETVDVMQAASMDKSKDSPVFDSAPPLLQEELIFPYREGMTFIKELLVNGGKKAAFAGALDRMPQTTREIMEPKEYLAGRRVPPLLLPDMGFLKKEYEGYDAGAVGELDVKILLKIYADEKVAARLTPEWRGGAYYAAGRKGAKPPDKNSSAHVGLYYISKWATDGAAQEFAKVYSAALKQRYNGLQRAAGSAAKPGLAQFASTDGPIFIQQTGSTVVATESFDPESADQLIQAGLKHGQQEPQPAAGSVR
ncbi:MAG TPA: hypothetical protein VKW06_06400 [Candidatus Angelobacter sp.]|nr:hypothetical protein [Candidatus Angelobacter sp.]